MSWMLYAFFWVIPRRLNFICRRFGTFCMFHLCRQVGACRMNSAGDMFGVLYRKRVGLEMAWAIRTEGDRVGGGSKYRNKLWRMTVSRIIPQTCPQPSSFYTHLPAYEDGTVCSETSAYKIQTPGNHPEEIIQHSGYGENLKSRILLGMLTRIFNKTHLQYFQTM